MVDIIADTDSFSHIWFKTAHAVIIILREFSVLKFNKNIIEFIKVPYKMQNYSQFDMEPMPEIKEEFAQSKYLNQGSGTVRGKFI